MIRQSSFLSYILYSSSWRRSSLSLLYLRAVSALSSFSCIIRSLIMMMKSSLGLLRGVLGLSGVGLNDTVNAVAALVNCFEVEDILG